MVRFRVAITVVDAVENTTPDALNSDVPEEALDQVDL
jgi:hypothetical protein